MTQPTQISHANMDGDFNTVDPQTTPRHVSSSSEPTMTTTATAMNIMSAPISIASPASSRKSSFSDYSSSFSSTTSSTNPFSSCTLRRQSIDRPSAYVSDEDLFGDDMDEPYLSEPPQAPRSAEQWLARPLLPPVTSPMPSAQYKRKAPRAVKFRKSSLGR